MTNRKELNNEELEKVSGGISDSDLKQQFRSEVDKYDVKAGGRYYFLWKENNSTYESYKASYGLVLRTYEASADCGTVTTFDVQCEYGFKAGTTIVVNTYRGTAYKYSNLSLNELNNLYV